MDGDATVRAADRADVEVQELRATFEVRDEIALPFSRCRYEPVIGDQREVEMFRDGTLFEFTDERADLRVDVAERLGECVRVDAIRVPRLVHAREIEPRQCRPGACAVGDAGHLRQALGGAPVDREEVAGNQEIRWESSCRSSAWRRVAYGTAR